MEAFSKKYYSILTNELAGLNLTRILDYDEFYQKQVIDSLLPIENSKFFTNDLNKTKLLVDVGFGGGFPILPLAYKFPEYFFIGIEARKKKADAVTLIAKQLSLKNVKLYHHRLEDLFIDREVIFTFKAVSEIEKLLKKISTNQTVKAYFYKGPNVESLEKIDGIKGWNRKEKLDISVPYADGRTLISYENINVPRGTIKSKNKNLVNLSNLI